MSAWIPRDGSLDDTLAEQLLDGAGHDSVPARYLPLVSLVAAARTPATEAELAGQDAAVAVFRARRPVAPGSRGRSHRAKGFLLVSAVVASTAAGAAAATGNLPDPAQDLAAELLELIGIHVPSSAPDRDIPTDPGSSSAVPWNAMTGPVALPTSAPAPTGTTDGVADRFAIWLVGTGGPPATAPVDLGALLDDSLQAGVAGMPLALPGDLPTVASAAVDAATGQLHDVPPSSPGAPPATPVGPPPSTLASPPPSTPVGSPPSTPVGPPAGVPGGPPAGVPGGPPAGVPGGPPGGVPDGPPGSTPVGPPAGVATGGPPPSLPGAPPVEPPGPPEAPPAGPPTSVPGDPPAGVPSGPPLVVPGPPPPAGP